MNGYSLDINISSDEGMTSTPIKTVPVNMVGKLNISDSSLEAWRSTDAELDSTFETDCDVKKTEPTPKKKKLLKFRLICPPQEVQYRTPIATMRSQTHQYARPPR